MSDSASFPQAPDSRNRVIDRLALARGLLADWEERTGVQPAHPARRATGLAALDAALGGGLRRGTVCRVTSDGEGMGALSLALAIARPRLESVKYLFLIDPCGEFYPPAAARMGFDLTRLVIVRPQRAAGVWTMAQTLRCSAAGAVVALAETLDTRSLRQVQLAAEAGGGLGLLVQRGREAAAGFGMLRIAVETAGEIVSDDPAAGSEIRRLGVRVYRGSQSVAGPLAVELGAGQEEFEGHECMDDAREWPKTDPHSPCAAARA